MVFWIGGALNLRCLVRVSASMRSPLGEGGWPQLGGRGKNKSWNGYFRYRSSNLGNLIPLVHENYNIVLIIKNTNTITKNKIEIKYRIFLKYHE